MLAPLQVRGTIPPWTGISWKTIAPTRPPFYVEPLHGFLRLLR